MKSAKRTGLNIPSTPVAVDDRLFVTNFDRSGQYQFESYRIRSCKFIARKHTKLRSLNNLKVSINVVSRVVLSFEILLDRFGRVDDLDRLESHES